MKAQALLGWRPHPAYFRQFPRDGRDFSQAQEVGRGTDYDVEPSAFLAGRDDNLSLS